MDSLFPEDIEDEEEEDIEEVEDEVIGYAPSYYFDFEKGDFSLNGKGQVIKSSGIDAWMQWCTKQIQTKRYVCDAYTTDVGIDVEAVFAAKTPEEAESILEREIMDALSVDPYGRTQYIQSIKFEWDCPDCVLVEVDVVGLDSELITIRTSIVNQ